MGQLRINNTGFFIGEAAVVTVQSDVSSTNDIEGPGLLLLNGKTKQHLDLGGKTISNLELDNSSNIFLVNNSARISSMLLFTKGKLQVGDQNLILAPNTKLKGFNEERFVSANASGQLVKEIANDVSNMLLPVGDLENYRPVYLTCRENNYLNANFRVSVNRNNSQSILGDGLYSEWIVSRNGISGGSLFVAAKYHDPLDVKGSEFKLEGYFDYGMGKNFSGEIHNPVTNIIGVPVPGNGIISASSREETIEKSIASIAVYPNPVTKGFYVKLPSVYTKESVQLKLRNNAGQIISTKDLNASVATTFYFDISNQQLASGTYYLQILSGNKIIEDKKIFISQSY